MPLEQRTCECGRFFLSARKGVFLCRWCRRSTNRRNASQRRSARESNAPGKHTIPQWTNQIESQDSRCYWCHCSLLDDVGNFHGEKDHLVPLSRGGSQNITNIVAACTPCNSEKQARTWQEYSQFLLRSALPHSQFVSTVSTLPSSKKAPRFRSPENLLIATIALSRRKRVAPEAALNRRAYLKAQAALVSLNATALTAEQREQILDQFAQRLTDKSPTGNGDRAPRDLSDLMGVEKSSKLVDMGEPAS